MPGGPGARVAPLGDGHDDPGRARRAGRPVLVSHHAARRATFDPTYGRYTWGKLEILKLRERARKDWGAGFTLQRFHKALLDLGSPPLGLLGTAVDRG